MVNNNNSTATRMVCAIIFGLFCFIFLYRYQGDILVFKQFQASRGETHYEILLGALLVTVVLFILQIGIYFITRLKGIFHAITYFPSLIILTFLTQLDTFHISYRPQGNEWIWQLSLLIAIWGIVTYIAIQYQKVEIEIPHNGIFSQLTFINLFTLTILILIPCLIGNNDRIFHQRIHQEYLIEQQQPDKAWQIGKYLNPENKNQVMINAYCLMQMHHLGDSLFTLQLPMGMTTLMPNTDNGYPLVLNTQAIVNKTKHHRDYLLSKFLLKRDLDHFVEKLPKWYDLKKTLPQHYREAMVLYTAIKPKPSLHYVSEELEPKLIEFQQLRHKGHFKELKDKYEHTYWYYYYRSK